MLGFDLRLASVCFLCCGEKGCLAFGTLVNNPCKRLGIVFGSGKVSGDRGNVDMDTSESSQFIARMEERCSSPVMRSDDPPNADPLGYLVLAVSFENEAVILRVTWYKVRWFIFFRCVIGVEYFECGQAMVCEINVKCVFLVRKQVRRGTR